MRQRSKTHITLETPAIFLSIIIPTFNRRHLISPTIKSILSQPDFSLELIIIDDGGEDDTAQLISALNNPKIKYCRTKNRERGAARNFGAKLAKGKYINYFDSDDILNPCLSQLYQFIQENNSPDIVYGLIENITEAGTSIELITPAFDDFKKAILHNNFLACGSVFIKRELALKFQFSEDRRLSGTEDWELWLRLYSQHEFVKFPGIIFKQRQHSSRSLTTASAARVTEREITFIEHINNSRQLLSNRFSKTELGFLIADRYTLTALAQCESKDQKLAFKYWIKSLLASGSVLKRKRFWAVLKKMFTDWI